jgi:polysaccharide export outer membrane protein
MKYFIIALLAAIFFLPSCVSVKPVQYLESRKDTTITDALSSLQPRIQPGDMISVMVYSDNPTASALYNPGGGSPSGLAGDASGQSAMGASSTAAGSNAGYQVMENGSIVMPGVGPVPVKGFTCQQLADSLRQYFVDHRLLQNPACDVRYLSYKISVLGEVGHPGVYSVPSNQVNILQALGLAGDFTIWSVKDNVTVLREVNGEKLLGKIDLTSSEAFRSPYFNLRPNDIVMVDANKRKMRAMDQTDFRYITIAASLVSTVGLLITIFRR